MNTWPPDGPPRVYDEYEWFMSKVPKAKGHTCRGCGLVHAEWLVREYPAFAPMETCYLCDGCALDYRVMRVLAS